MAIEYELTLAGDIPVNRVAERAFPLLDDRPTGTAPLLTADLDEKYGFDVSVAAGKNAYISTEGDDDMLEWEPEAFVSVTFGLDKTADRQWAVTNVLTVVRRVLNTGPEETVFRYNADLLLFTRFNGQLIKHHREPWWAQYAAANQLIPG